LEALDRALMAGKTPPEFALEGNLRRLVLQHFRQYRQPENQPAMVALIAEFLSRGDTRSMDIVRTAVLVAAAAPYGQLRHQAYILMDDLAHQVIAINNGDELVKLIALMEAGCLQEQDQSADGHRGPLRVLVDEIQASSLKHLSKKMGESLLRHPGQEPGLSGDPSADAGVATSSLGSGLVVPQMIEDLRHPQNWEVRWSFYYAEPCRRPRCR